MPPVLHRNPKDHGHRGPHRQIPAQVRDGLNTVRASSPWRGALLLGAALFTVNPAAATTGDCPSARIDAYARSAYIFDGDTLRLADGRRVRLVGIDTPEIAHEQRAAQPLADAARAMLARLAPPGSRLGLRYAAERHDRYGRTLAHLFIDDGANIQTQLLNAGLATSLAMPPNLWSVDCYAAAEHRARRARRGLWALARYQPVAAAALPAAARGYRVVRGRVTRIGHGRHNLWLNLARHMALRIPRADLGYFRGMAPRRLLGRRVEVRGFVQRRHRESRITLRYPTQLRVLR